jgi:hypothetical protein
MHTPRLGLQMMELQRQTERWPAELRLPLPNQARRVSNKTPTSQPPRHLPSLPPRHQSFIPSPRRSRTTPTRRTLTHSTSSPHRGRCHIPRTKSQGTSGHTRPPWLPTRPTMNRRRSACGTAVNVAVKTARARVGGRSVATHARTVGSWSAKDVSQIRARPSANTIDIYCE